VSDMLKSLEKLANDMASEEGVSLGPDMATLHIHDLHERFRHLLTPEVATAFEVPLYYTGEDVTAPGIWTQPPGTKAIYLSTLLDDMGKLEAAAKAIYGVVESLHQKGVLKGHLAKLSYLATANKDFRIRLNPETKLAELVETEVPQKWMVFCFPHVARSFDEQVPYQFEPGAEVPLFQGE
jgi:hypothetical protein